MYSFSKFEPVYFSKSSFNCCLLACLQVSQGEGVVVWYSQLFKNFPQFVLSYTVKGFCFITETEVAFLEFPSKEAKLLP